MDDMILTTPSLTKKLQQGKLSGRPLYVSGGTGCGKTTFIRNYLRNRKYAVCPLAGIGADKAVRDLEQLFSDSYAGEPVVIDDLQFLRDQRGRQELIRNASRRDIWLILISESAIPTWLLKTSMDQKFILCQEKDLLVSDEEAAKYFVKSGIGTLDKEEVKQIAEICGHRVGYLHRAVQLMQEGKTIKQLLDGRLFQEFQDYCDFGIIPNWNRQLQDFMMKVSCVDEFDEKLAANITGSSETSQRILEAKEVGSFLKKDGKQYRIDADMLAGLRQRAKRLLGEEIIQQCEYNAGLYYEEKNDCVMALQMFEKCHDEDKVAETLERNAFENVSTGQYYALRKCYLSLPDDKIKSPALMAGMAMLNSCLFDVKKSEYWYDKLKDYSASAQGGQKREAIERLAYLDISLPHRGNDRTMELLKSYPETLYARGMTLPPISVTSNMPSFMAGGKDFWMYAKDFEDPAERQVVEEGFGKWGIGLSCTIEGELLFERAENDFRAISLLSQGYLQTEQGGRLEVGFASVGTQARLNAMRGRPQTALSLLGSFEKRVREENVMTLFPNIQALECRIHILNGDLDNVREWKKYAPDDNIGFNILQRYEYLTRIRCSIALHQYDEAAALIAKMLYYTQKYKMTYLHTEALLLSAIVQYRMEERGWKGDLISAMSTASRYRFVRLIAGFGGAILEPLRALGAKELSFADSEWLQKVMQETQKIEERYPSAYSRQGASRSDFSENALAILKLQTEGLSVPEIANRLGLKTENVRYHIKQNYRKLGVSDKVSAALEAKKLMLL
ncbi:MAG: LuxR C-terminal-related transcriptional regulator [Lachnospiraceae bacterium]